MFEKLQQKKIIVILAVVLLVVALLVLVLSQRESSPDLSEVSRKIEKLQETQQIVIPTLAPSEGEGIDLNSMQVKKSEQEIIKLENALPYYETFTSSTAQEIEILIPSSDILMNSWVLTVNIFGPEYEIGPESDNYEVNRTSFREAAAKVYDFLTENNVNTDAVIIEWGDREFIRDRSLEWLEGTQ